MPRRKNRTAPRNDVEYGMRKWGWMIMICWIVAAGRVEGVEKVVTLVNPVRSRELWTDKSLKPIEDQYQIVSKNNLPATWLVQNDVLQDKELTDYLKNFDNQELGIFLEVSKNLVYRARIYFDEQKPWYDPGVVFLSGYSPAERRKIIDWMMTDFKDVFGYYPKSAGAWWVDSYSQQYLEKKYGVKAILICADQKTTDNYGIWGQWWGYPYFPDKDIILAPGNSKMLVIQWALRDPVLAYDGQGWQVSNHSLQANDYVSLGLKTDYYEKLANIYFDPRNRLGQITVGLETGMESVGNISEYEKQINWLVKNKIEALTMSRMAEKYREVYGGRNPEEILIENWRMTPYYRENKVLGDRVEYGKNLVFRDWYEADKGGFLNRIYEEKNLINKKFIDWGLVIKMGLVILGTVISYQLRVTSRKKVLILLLLVAGMWMVQQTRYSVVNGEKLIGVLVDNLWFVGINLSKGWVSQDMSNLVAQSMLRIKIDLSWIYFLLFGIIGGSVISWKLRVISGKKK